MLADVSREAGRLSGEFDEIAPDGCVDERLQFWDKRHFGGNLGGVSEVPTQFVELGQHLCGQPERLADIEHGAAKAIGRERGHERGVVFAVAVINLEQYLVSDIARKIKVDVGQ